MDRDKADSEQMAVRTAEKLLKVCSLTLFSTVCKQNIYTCTLKQRLDQYCQLRIMFSQKSY